jgi:uncharacterized protein
MTLASRVAGAMAKLPPPRTREVAVERDLAAALPDGVVLLADRWYPSGSAQGSSPTVLLRSPYGRRQLGLIGRLFAERGYQAVIQSCRGTFGSGGEWVPMRNEKADGAATLEWLAGQPWFDGTLCTFGPSYLGLTQWAVAEDAPEFVRALSLNVTASSFRDAVVYPGGSFALETGLSWLLQLAHQEGGLLHVIRNGVSSPRRVAAACGVLPLHWGDAALVGDPVGFYQDWLIHEVPGDAWWDEVDFGRRLDHVPPATLVGGWYDLFLPDQIADYQALRAAGRRVRLTIGPWKHASPGGMAAAVRDGLEFFDEQLAPVASPPRRAEVRVFVMGSARWKDFSQWPPPADEQRWYLERDHALRPVVPPADLPPDHYRYDPADPTPATGGPALLSKSAGPKDQREREARRDVLTYTSAPLTTDLTVIGHLTVRLHLRCSLPYADVFARLCDVTPKGKSVNLSDGLVRLNQDDMVNGDDGTFVVDLALWPTANTFKAGHRIRLQVSSGAHPLFARNPGTGEPLATATTLRAVEVEVWHDAVHPSCLVLPVVQ